jgi:hypothetical protein
MDQTAPAPVMSVSAAATALGYSRSTIHDRLNSGDLDRGVDGRGRKGVTAESVERYRAHPPPRSRKRPPPDGEVMAELQRENRRLRETISRLQMVREKEAAARRAETEANRHLRKALRKQAQATALTAEAGTELDELLIQYLTPDTILGAEA